MRRQIGDCTLYLADFDNMIGELEEVFAVVTDPPYGINEAAGKNKTRGLLAESKDYGNLDWDQSTCPDYMIEELILMSKWQIIFGGNFYMLPPSSCWLVWDKKINGDFADCELAWTNLPGAVRKIDWMWNGMLRKGSDVREHPTQKPVGVMKWCLDKLPDGSGAILDPFMGSGTTGVACVQRGRSFIGVEREPQYFEIACRRIEEAYRQGDLFLWESETPRRGVGEGS